VKEPISPLAVSPISFSPLIERSEFHNKTRVCGIFSQDRDRKHSCTETHSLSETT